MIEPKRKVLMLLENCPYEFDGRVPSEAGTLMKAGYAVSVVSVKPRRGRTFDVLNGVHLYQYPAPAEGSGLLAYLWEWTYALFVSFILSIVVLMRDGFDVVHTHNPPDILSLIAAFYKLFGKRFVFDHHDLSPEMYDARAGGGNRFLRSILVMFEQFSCRLADRIIATNASYKAMAVERGRVAPEKVTIVRNGPDLSRLNPVAADPDLRRRAGTILGYVGVMGPQDGVDHLLKALAHLVYDLGQRDVFCVLIGKGEMIPELKALAQQLRIADHVWFTGWVSDEDLVRYLSTADICVDPDPLNAFTDRSTMMKIMEYMALGKPIVAFDLCEHRVTAQAAAVYARPNEALDFAQQIALLMSEPARREAMGRFGRQRVENELAWPHQEKHLLEAYRLLFTRQPRVATNRSDDHEPIHDR
jgi:glycosyltransferase involved in cell wall biosynthesis